MSWIPVFVGNRNDRMLGPMKWGTGGRGYAA
jgi:hypothetical protein